MLVADNHYGWNRHSWDLHAHNGPHGYKLCLTAQILFFWAASLNKISLLCFYKRLTHGGVYKLWYKWCIIGGIAFITAMLIAFFLSAVFACQSVHPSSVMGRLLIHCRFQTALRLLVAIGYISPQVHRRRELHDVFRCHHNHP